MTVRVYQFGADSPIDLALVREQLRAAHDYRNELVAIERGRRDAMRALYDTPEIHAAEEALEQANKSERLAAKRALYTLRRNTLEAQRERAKEINDLAHELHLGARALTRCYWGSYLGIEAAIQAARSAPLYGDDGITPANPRFERWREFPLRGQIGVQIHARNEAMRTRDVLRGDCTFVRLVRDDGARPNARGKWRTLWIRVGSEGRDPIWARVRVCVHREIPDDATWKWVRLSVRPEGLRERWSVEITVDDPAIPARQLDTTIDGAVAVSWSWDTLSDGGICVASWRDTRGRSGEVILPERLAKGIRRPDGKRAVRDVLWNDAMPTIARAIKESKDPLPRWLSDAGNTLHLWRSLYRVHDLARRWRAECCDAARDAYELLDAWAERDWHLLAYESGERSQVLRQRRELYRTLAAQWARSYRHALVSDHDLSREARWADDSDVRFTAAPDELRQAIKNAFGSDAIVATWDRDPDWCERACACYESAGARGAMFAPPKEKTTNAWAERKKKKAEKEAARKEEENAAE